MVDFSNWCDRTEEVIGAQALQVMTARPEDTRTWSERRYWAYVEWKPGAAPQSASPLRLAYMGQRGGGVLSPDGEVLGELQAALNPNRRGLIRSHVLDELNKVAITYFGPHDLWLA